VFNEEAGHARATPGCLALPLIAERVGRRKTLAIYFASGPHHLSCQDSPPGAGRALPHRVGVAGGEKHACAVR
jgi:hypothetical protein